MAWTPERDAALEEEFTQRYDGSQLLAAPQPGVDAAVGAPTRSAASSGSTRRSKTAVLFSHVLWDANMFYGEDLFDDQEEWFVETVRAACANDRVNWIVKLHPANVWKRKRDGVEGRGARRPRRDPRADRRAAAAREARCSRTARSRRARSSTSSTGGSRSAARSASSCRASACRCSPRAPASTPAAASPSTPRTPRSTSARLARIEEIPPLTPGQVELARRHAYALFRLRPTPFTSFRSTIAPARQRRPARSTRTSRSRSARARSCSRPRICAVSATGRSNSRDLDYLQEP